MCEYWTHSDKLDIEEYVIAREKHKDAEFSDSDSEGFSEFESDSESDSEYHPGDSSNSESSDRAVRVHAKRPKTPYHLHCVFGLGVGQGKRKHVHSATYVPYILHIYHTRTLTACTHTVSLIY